MLQLKPDKEAFDRVCNDLDRGDILNCKHLVDIFGWPVVELLLLMASPDENHALFELLTELRGKIWIEKNAHS